VSGPPRGEPPQAGGYLPRDVTTPPRRLPRVGTILTLEPGQWRIATEPRRLVVLVTQVRADISTWYGGAWCWVHGDELDDNGRVVGPVQVLIDVDAIPDDATDPAR